MILTVHIQPNASRTECTGRTGEGIVRIRVQAPPVDGAANKALLKYLAKTFGVSKSRVTILRGASSRTKILEIDGDEQELRSRLENMQP